MPINKVNTYVKQSLFEIPARQLKEKFSPIKDYACRVLREAGEQFAFLKKGKAPPKDTGDIITDSFKSPEGVPLAYEWVERAKTVNLLKKQLLSEKNYKQLTEEEIAGITKQLEHLDNSQAEWASTNSPRYLFKTFSEVQAKARGLPLLINLRAHQVFIENSEVYCINRSAAISDFAHAETSLQELEDYKRLSSNQNNSKAITFKEKVHFFDYYNLDISNPKLVQKFLDDFEARVGKSYPLKTIEQIIKERKDLLQRQLLQDLYLHLTNHPATQGNLTFGRVGLLGAEKKPKINSSQYYINERNQLLDMKALYDYLNGKQVLFNLNDEDGPFFDSAGIIHMPKKLSKEGIEQANIRAVFFNIAVQGKRANRGLQKIVNDAAIERIHSWGINNEEFIKLYCKLKEAKTDFKHAHFAIELLKKVGYCSVDCYGGKDRTGYVLAQETFYNIKKWAKNQNLSSKQMNSYMAKVGRQLLSKKGVAVKVAKDSTSWIVLKLSAFNLKLYASDSKTDYLKGLGHRILDYGKLLYSSLLKHDGNPKAFYYPHKGT